MLKVRFAAAFFGLAIISSAVVQARTAVAPTAPIPSQILTAKRVFIANAGGESDAKTWSGGPARPYNELYAAIKSWGHYGLVVAPADADLVLQISFSDTLTDVGGSKESGPVSSRTAQLNLVVLDPKTHMILWTINEKTSMAHLQKGRDQALAESINKLVDSLKELTSQPASTVK